MFREFVFCYSVDVTELVTLSPLGPVSPGVPGKPGGPSGPCEETIINFHKPSFHGFHWCSEYCAGKKTTYSFSVLTGIALRE